MSNYLAYFRRDILRQSDEPMAQQAHQNVERTIAYHWGVAVSETVYDPLQKHRGSKVRCHTGDNYSRQAQQRANAPVASGQQGTGWSGGLRSCRQRREDALM